MIYCVRKSLAVAVLVCWKLRYRPFACLSALCQCVCASFPFGFEGGMWNLIVLVLGHCLSFCYTLGHVTNTFLFYIDN